MKHYFLIILIFAPLYAMQPAPESQEIVRKQRQIANLATFEHECIKLIHHEVKKMTKQIQEGGLPVYNFYPGTQHLTLSNVTQRSHATANIERYGKFTEKPREAQTRNTKAHHEEEKKVIEVLVGNKAIVPEEAPEVALEVASKKQFKAFFSHIICQVMEQQDWQMHLEQFRAQAAADKK